MTIAGRHEFGSKAYVITTWYSGPEILIMPGPGLMWLVPKKALWAYWKESDKWTKKPIVCAHSCQQYCSCFICTYNLKQEYWSNPIKKKGVDVDLSGPHHERIRWKECQHHGIIPALKWEPCLFQFLMIPLFSLFILENRLYWFRRRKKSTW